MASSLSLKVDIKGGSQIAAQLLGYGNKLQESMHEAMEDVKDVMVPAVQSQMHWKKPTGVLEDSIASDSYVASAWKAKIGSSLPYAMRREKGFSGRTDSLGRYYPNDPGAFYLAQSLTDHKQDITERIQYAASQSLNPLGI
jgi:hypothetical protein